MNIHTGARRLLISFVCVFMAFLLLILGRLRRS